MTMRRRGLPDECPEEVKRAYRIKRKRRNKLAYKSRLYNIKHNQQNGNQGKK